MFRLFITLYFLHCFQLFAQVQPIDEIWEPVDAQYNSPDYAKVAVLQWAPHGVAPLNGQNAANVYKEKNRQELKHYITQAANQGAKLIITPEFGVVGYPDIADLPSEEDNFQNYDQIALYAETLKGPSVTFFSQLAKDLKIYIHFGFALLENVKIYNALVAVNDQGEIVAVHKKNHLYQIEKKYLSSGVDATTYNSPFGKIGLAICSDIYYSPLLNAYRENEVDIIALSTSWAQYNSGWSFYVSAAKNVASYLLASNHNYFPDSGVINPDGSTQSHIRQSDGLAYGYIPYKKD
jgi:predicted amidohydrolase